LARNYAWLELLKEGIIWRVVSGSKIRIWRDNWLPSGNMNVFGNASGSRLRWVSDLIDPVTRTWKEDIVRSIFYHPDAEEVLQIRIPNLNGEDFIAWEYKKWFSFQLKVHIG
jgi:hypothetical protein